MRIAVVGLGKLGLPLAALYAQAGHEVHGIDSDEALVGMLNSDAMTEFVEPGLDGLLFSCSENLTFHSTYMPVQDCQVTFVVVPTPSKKDGSYSLTFMLDAVQQIGQQLSVHKRRHMVVIVSTVNPTDMETHIAKELYLSARKRPENNLAIGLVYSPEFIALGNVIDGMKHPDFVLVGAASSTDIDAYANLVNDIIDSGTPVLSTTFSNAELAKIAINSYVTMKISFANMIGALCEKFEGGNADAVLQIVGSDRRIGSAYLKAGGPFGGPCFPRDNRALQHFAGRMEVGSALPWATDYVNGHTVGRIANAAREAKLATAAKRFVIVGVAYKQGTAVTDESLGIQLLALLSPTDVWDGVEDCSDAVVIMATPGSEAPKSAKAYIDVWGDMETTHKVVRIGKHQ